MARGGGVLWRQDHGAPVQAFTGPFKLADWRRSSRIVLDRNPNYREVLYNEVRPPMTPRLAAEMAAPPGASACPLWTRLQIRDRRGPQPAGSALRAARPTSSSTCRRVHRHRHAGQQAGAQLAKLSIRVLVRVQTGPDISVTYHNMEAPGAGRLHAREYGAAPSTWPGRGTRKCACPAAARLAKAQGVVPLTSFGLAGLQDRDERVNLPKAKALLDLWRLHRQRRRWLARPADGKPWS